MLTKRRTKKEKNAMHRRNSNSNNKKMPHFGRSTTHKNNEIANIIIIIYIYLHVYCVLHFASVNFIFFALCFGFFFITIRNFFCDVPSHINFFHVDFSRAQSPLSAAPPPPPR